MTHKHGGLSSGEGRFCCHGARGGFRESRGVRLLFYSHLLSHTSWLCAPLCVDCISCKKN